MYPNKQKRKNSPDTESLQDQLIWLLDSFIQPIPITILIVLVIGIMIYNQAYWAYNQGQTPDNVPNGSLGTAVPTFVPAPTLSNPWQEHQFLSAEQARELRKQPNVVNLAVLSRDGNVSYSADTSTVFTAQEPWQKVTITPMGFQQLGVLGTSVQLKINAEYTLNMLQPFTVDQQPHLETIYIVDLRGQLWQAPIGQLAFVPLDVAIKSLPQPISPNPNLSFTY